MSSIDPRHQTAVIAYWDAVASTYVSRFRNELENKPLDQAVLREFALKLGKDALVFDLGCGPCAHITSFLRDCGVKVVGADLSPACIELARKEQPSLDLRVMDAANLQMEDSSLDGLVAYYLLHYMPKQSWPEVVQGFARVLKRGGQFLIVMKDGNGEGWIEDPMGGPLDTYWAACSLKEFEHLLQLSNFRIIERRHRSALAHEIPIDRIYLLAECSKR